MMNMRGATHAQLTSNEPILLCINGQWQQGQVVVPDAVFAGMSEVVQQKQAEGYRFRVLSGPPVTLTISRLADDGQPLPAPPSATTPTAPMPVAPPPTAAPAEAAYAPWSTPAPQGTPGPPPLPASPPVMPGHTPLSPAETWKPPTRAEEAAEKVFVTSFVVIALVIVFGIIGFFTANSRNRNKDYSVELATVVEERFNAQNNAMQLSEVKLIQETPRKYNGDAKYVDGDRGDVTIQIDSRDWLGRPDNYTWSVSPRSYGGMLAEEIRQRANEVYSTRGGYVRVRSITLTRIARNSYTGIVDFGDDDKGSIAVTVTSFDSDGSPATWSYSIEVN